MPAWMGLSHGGFRGGRCSKSDGEGPFSVVDESTATQRGDEGCQVHDGDEVGWKQSTKTRIRQ